MAENEMWLSPGGWRFQHGWFMQHSYLKDAQECIYSVLAVCLAYTYCLVFKQSASILSDWMPFRCTLINQLDAKEYASMF